MVERAELKTKEFEYRGPARFVIPIITIVLIGSANFIYEYKATGFPEASAAFVLCAFVVAIVGIILYYVCLYREK